MATSWINTEDRLPEQVEDQFGFIVSSWVLARCRDGSAWVATLRRYRVFEDEIEPARWIARGPDGYELRDVVAWTEIPA